MEYLGQLVWAANPIYKNLGMGLFGLMWVIVALCIFAVKDRAGAKIIIWLGLGLASYTVYGLLRGNYLPFVALDVTNMGFLFVSVLFAEPSNRAYLLRMFLNGMCYALVVALLVVVVMLERVGFTPGNLDTRFSFDETTSNSDLFALTGLLGVSVFLAPFAPYVKGARKFIVPIAIIVYGGFAFLTASRNALTSACIGLVVTTWCISRQDKKRRFRNLLMICVLVGIAAGGVFTLYGERAMQDLMELQRARQNAEDFTSGRIDEALGALQELKVGEFVIGRGFGAAKDNLGDTKSINGVPMVHFGPVHIILKGGIMLLLVLYGTLIYCVLRARSRAAMGYECAYVICLFLAREMSHQQWHDFSALVVVAMCIGMLSGPSNIRQKAVGQ